MNAEFAELSDTIVQWLWKHKPVAATYTGEHSQDERYAIFNVEYFKDFVDTTRQYNNQLRRLKDKELDTMEQIHRDLLRATLEVTIAEVENLELHTRAADLYISEILSGLQVLVSNEFARVDSRAVGVLGRMRGIWRVLREGMANLRAGRNVPKLWTENAIQITEATLRFYDTHLDDFINKVGDKQLQYDLNDAVMTSRSAIEHYLNFLRLDMLASSKGRCAVGREHFTLLLRTKHRFKIQLSELLAQGEKMIEEERAALVECAYEIDPDKSWKEIINEERQKPLSEDELLTRYDKELKRAKRFCNDNELFPLPPSMSTLRVAWTPGQFRHLYPYTTLVEAAPLDTKFESTFYVAQVETNRHDEIKRQQLRGHFPAQMPLAAVQLGYPGQHVAAIYRQQIEDPILKIHRGGFPYLAWGFYTATLMFEQGYFKTPIERLIYHRERLLNALRLVIDIKYHVHEQTMDELTTLLVEEGGLQQANAEREGRRYASQPTHQVALMIGLQKIEELKQAIQKKLGNKFTLAHFHQILLSAGHLPAEVILSLYNKGLLQLVSFDDKKAPAKASKAVKKPAAAKKTAPAKKPAAKKPAAKKPAAAKSGTAKKAAPAKKTPAKKAAPKKGPVKSSAKKTAAKTITKSTAKKPAAKKTAAKKAAPVKKSTTSRASSSRSKASTSRTKSAASGSSSKTKRTTAKSVTKPAAKAKATAKAKSTSSSSKAKKAAKPTATHSKTAARRSPAKGKSTSRKRS